MRRKSFLKATTALLGLAIPSTGLATSAALAPIKPIAEKAVAGSLGKWVHACCIVKGNKPHDIYIDGELTTSPPTYVSSMFSDLTQQAPEATHINSFYRREKI